MHLHFEVWRGGASDRFDPQPFMLGSWEYLPDPGDQSPVLVARNAQPGAPAYGVPVRAHMRRWPRHGR
jgi:hypothetical protein